MAEYYVMTESGTTPPKFKHHSADAAIIEVSRLHHLLNTKVYILEVVGTLSFEDVPVTKRESIKRFSGRLQDDLPF